MVETVTSYNLMVCRAAAKCMLDWRCDASMRLVLSPVVCDLCEIVNTDAQECLGGNNRDWRLCQKGDSLICLRSLLEQKARDSFRSHTQQSVLSLVLLTAAVGSAVCMMCSKVRIKRRAIPGVSLYTVAITLKLSVTLQRSKHCVSATSRHNKEVEPQSEAAIRLGLCGGQHSAWQVKQIFQSYTETS